MVKWTQEEEGCAYRGHGGTEPHRDSFDDRSTAQPRDSVRSAKAWPLFAPGALV